ncbi:hypothetical protein NDU88_004522 [Pleurodeles waltl]|uniref:Uncharacterized protein n=1 Tax=Pleurodeles waltl TaxID=8319 RepID=A0AAV7W7R0_PLEWA|nr:hypothetical protein NDU88_004522 [Pleurodeles waltl]
MTSVPPVEGPRDILHTSPILMDVAFTTKLELFLGRQCMKEDVASPPPPRAHEQHQQLVAAVAPVYAAALAPRAGRPGSGESTLAFAGRDGQETAWGQAYRKRKETIPWDGRAGSEYLT